jgi:O-antigen/teichoic acid export membrane protein
MHFNTILKHIIVWKMMNTLLMFSINLLLVRLLGVAASGQFFYDITVLSFIILLLSWCLESGITYYASKDNKLIVLILVFILPLLLVQAGVCVFLLQYIKFSLSTALAVLFVLSNLTIIYFSAFFYAKKWFINPNIIICGINFATALLLLYWWLTGASLAAVKFNQVILIYIGGAVTQALLLLAIILFSVKKNRIVLVGVTAVAKNIFTYSSIAFISNVVSFLVSRIDYFFVQKYCSGIALSNYIQVSKFGQMLILVPAIIASIVFPLSAGSSEIIPTDKVQQLCRGISFIFIPVTITVILTANSVLPWMFGTGFNYMYLAILLYMPGFFSLSIITILAAHLAGKNLLRVNLFACLLALIVVVTGDFLVVPIGGINGAAAVSSIAYLIYLTYLVLVYKKKFNSVIADFFFFKRTEVAGVFLQIKKVFTPRF